MTLTKSYTVLEAVKQISSHCDWAKEKDGVGFNATDSGLNLVACYSKLTVQDQEKIKPVIWKYRNQLGISSIDELTIVDYGSSDKVIGLEQIDERKTYIRKKVTKGIEYKTGRLVVTFDYDADFVAGVKTIPGAKFNWDQKFWSVPVTKETIPVIGIFLEDFHFEFDNDKLIGCLGEQEDTSIIVLKGSSIVISFDYNPQMVEEVKKISGRKFDPATKSWVAELNVASVTGLRSLITNFKFTFTPDVELAIINFEQQLLEKDLLLANNLEASKLMTGEVEIPTFRGTLRPFQKAGVNYILTNKRVIVGDEMGLGKTIEAIAAIEKSANYPALISCPNSLKYNWQREFNKFVTRKVVVINSDTDKFEKADVYITNYNSLVKFESQFAKMNFKTVISDESHYLKTAKAQRTVSFTKIVETCNPELVLLLTGTTIVNRPSELISPLTILGKLQEFGGFWNFAKHYCSAYRNRYGLDISGASNLPELHNKLRSICYIRREKKDVLQELPAKSRQVIEVDIDNRVKYEKAKNDIINYLKKEAGLDEKFSMSLSGLTKEESVAAIDNYRKEKAKKAEQAEHLVRINELKKLAIEGKLSETINWIKDMIEAGEKLVVFGIHRATVAALANEFKCNKIDGSVTIEDRDKYVQDFQNNTETRLIVLNITAGSVGLTLTAANKLAFVEMGWTPGEHDQAEDRIHRIGQVDPVNIYYILGTGTIDIDIYELIEAKREITNAVNKGEDASQNISVMGELLKRLIN